jgi:glutaminase
LDQRLHAMEAPGAMPVSTGQMPPAEQVRALMREAWKRFAPVTEGRVADDIPALAEASPALFGLCITGADGSSFAVGDADQPFSIQSMSKPFVFALVCQALGGGIARERIGVNATGLPFNSVMAIEATKFLSEGLGLNLFASRPLPAPG